MKDDDGVEHHYWRVSDTSKRFLPSLAFRLFFAQQDDSDELEELEDENDAEDDDEASDESDEEDEESEDDDDDLDEDLEELGTDVEDIKELYKSEKIKATNQETKSKEGPRHFTHGVNQ